MENLKKHVLDLPIWAVKTREPASYLQWHSRLHREISQLRIAKLLDGLRHLQRVVPVASGVDLDQFFMSSCPLTYHYKLG